MPKRNDANTVKIRETFMKENSRMFFSGNFSLFSYFFCESVGKIFFLDAIPRFQELIVSSQLSMSRKTIVISTSINTYVSVHNFFR